jgi:hypothetical protein
MTIAIAYIIFIQMGAVFGDARIFWFSLFALCVIWIDELKVPAFIAHPLHLIGQATFYIFLGHYPSFGITLRLGELLNIGSITSQPVILFCSGLLYPILLWIGVTALRRAHIRTREMIG